ncbi:MAG: MarR family transcriptional regulator [Planctomycetaceae bacterium]|nr:MarR family transcriptional regulator [Planctomycetaceae bacterium]
MLQFDFEESLGYWVCSTAQACRRALNTELEKQGITFRQWEVLAWIALEGEMSQVELAECLGIEAPTLVGILDRMERDGWLDRYCCEKDRRKKRIRATPKADTVWVKMVDCAHRVRAQAREGMTQEELDLLKSFCERIKANLSDPTKVAQPAAGAPAPLPAIAARN